MELDRTILKEAVTRGIISSDQAERVWALSTALGQDSPGFRYTHVLYYLGGLIAIGAMSLFMNLGWERFGGWGLLVIALAYGASGLALTEYLFTRMRLPVPAGITAAFVVTLTPLAVYGLQTALGYWPDARPYRDYHTLVDWRWMLMELATLAAGTLLLWRYGLPFMVMPVSVTLWYMSMDLAPFLFGVVDLSWVLREMVSLWFGLLMLLVALWVDIRTRGEGDYAFWLYLFGALAFWGSLSWMCANSEVGRFIYLCINLAMIAIGAVLSRRVFAIFGGLGTAAYLGHLAHGVFRDSMLFPFALTAIGLAVVFLGIVWQRHEERIAARLCVLLPGPLKARVGERR